MQQIMYMEMVPFALLAEKNPDFFSCHKWIQQLYNKLKVTFSNYINKQ